MAHRRYEEILSQLFVGATYAPPRVVLGCPGCGLHPEPIGLSAAIHHCHDSIRIESAIGFTNCPQFSKDFPVVRGIASTDRCT
jgi:hypothetical protein